MSVVYAGGCYRGHLSFRGRRSLIQVLKDSSSAIDNVIMLSKNATVWQSYSESIFSSHSFFSIWYFMDGLLELYEILEFGKAYSKGQSYLISDESIKYQNTNIY